MQAHGISSNNKLNKTRTWTSTKSTDRVRQTTTLKDPIKWLEKPMVSIHIKESSVKLKKIWTAINTPQEIKNQRTSKMSNFRQAGPTEQQVRPSRPRGSQSFQHHPGKTALTSRRPDPKSGIFSIISSRWFSCSRDSTVTILITIIPWTSVSLRPQNAVCRGMLPAKMMRSKANLFQKSLPNKQNLATVNPKNSSLSSQSSG